MALPKPPQPNLLKQRPLSKPRKANKKGKASSSNSLSLYPMLSLTTVMPRAAAPQSHNKSSGKWFRCTGTMPMVTMSATAMGTLTKQKRGEEAARREGETITTTASMAARPLPTLATTMKRWTMRHSLKRR